jgi:4-amino-4-deoxy-L-arabinose transferase-like glycosyltransferase
MAAELAEKALPFDPFETRRLLGAVVGIIGLGLTWRLARRIAGPLAGLIALTVLACSPHYYGHMFINAKDAPFAVAMMVLLFGLVRTLEDYPRPRMGTVALFGLGLGLALGTRIIGGIAALYMIVPMAMLIADDTRRAGVRQAAINVGGFLSILLPGFVLAYAIMGLLWPWSVLEPLNPLRAVGYFAEFFEKPWREMFEGVAISVPDMPRSYIPVLFSIKMPEVFLFLSVAGLVSIGASLPDTAIPLRRRAILTLVAMAALLPLVIAIVTRPAMYNGIRHFTFVFPPLAVVAGLAGAWIITYFRKKSRRAAAIAGLAIVLGLTLPATTIYRLHPYQYAYFNWLSGGVKAADERYMLDYWGLAFKQASKELRRKLAERLDVPADGHRWRIAVCGPHSAAEQELGSKFLATWDTKGADFAMMLGEFYCAELNAPVLVEIKRDDVVFARVYDLRGRNITDMFTIPPVTR